APRDRHARARAPRVPAADGARLARLRARADRGLAHRRGLRPDTRPAAASRPARERPGALRRDGPPPRPPPAPSTEGGRSMSKTNLKPVSRGADRPPFRVKDLALAELGRKEIRLAEQEMPGLMALRAQHAAAKPLRGAKVMGSLHMTVQTAVLIETLV